MTMKYTAAVVVMLSLSACDDPAGQASSSQAAASSDLSSFVGARAGQAELGLQNLGYEWIRAEGLTGYWFNRADGSCAAITTASGRYETIEMLPAQDC
jgi:hypothetical protein